MDHSPDHVEKNGAIEDEDFNPLDDPEERQVVYKAINSFQ